MEDYKRMHRIIILLHNKEKGVRRLRLLAVTIGKFMKEWHEGRYPKSIKVYHDNYWHTATYDSDTADMTITRNRGGKVVWDEMDFDEAAALVENSL